MQQPARSADFLLEPKADREAFLELAEALPGLREAGGRWRRGVRAIAGYELIRLELPQLVPRLIAHRGFAETGVENALSTLVAAPRVLQALAELRHPLLGVLAGAAFTALVQSSSTVTTVIVGLVAGGAFTPEQAVPMVMGANIGTTVTALLVSLAASKDPQAGLHIALVHLFFNIAGTIVIYGLPPLRRIPLVGARWLAGLSLRNRSLALVYILGVYFLLPLLIIGIMKLFGDEPPPPPAPTEAIPEAGSSTGS